MKSIEEIKDLLNKIPYLNISSITPDGKPWLSPCWAAYDNKITFYWTSSPDSQHSKNISNSPDILFVVYDSSVPKDGWGLYAQAKACELEDIREIQMAIDIFYKRKMKEPMTVKYFTSESPRRMYKAVIEKSWINNYDKSRTPADFKIEVDLKNN